MSKSKFQNLRLGIFVIAGTLFIIAALYFIGSKQNLFGKTFRVKARFENVNGLMEGNNVRFSGIDVGTVENIEIVNDTTVMVTMIIQDKVKPFIKKNSIASIGTDGLMGNKLVNINSVKEKSVAIEEGDEITSEAPLDLGEAMITLNATNRNLSSISDNLVEFTDKINAENSLWQVLSDPAVADDVKSALRNLKATSEQSRLVMTDLKKISNEIKNGKGTIGTLLNDTAFAGQLENTILKLERFGDSLNQVSSSISGIITDLKNGKGTAGKLLQDTTLIHQLNKSLQEIEKGAAGFDENMEALKSSWPFKKYFKKKKKEESKSVPARKI